MMKEIISTNVIVRNKFTMKKMLEIFQASKQYNGSTFLYSNHKAVDATNLTKLVSFLLTCKTKSTLKIIVEGENVQEHLDLISNVCTGHVTILKISQKRFLNTSETFQL